MKKFLSGLISLSMIGTYMVSFATHASAAKYTTISTIFEEDYDGETVTANASGTGEILTDETTGNKYMKMNRGYSTNQFAYTFPAITTGKIAVQFDYMKDAETLDYQSYIALADNNLYETKEYLRLLSTNNYGSKQNKMTAFKTEMISSDSITEAGQWYTFKYVIDMDTHDVSVTLYKKGNTAPMGTLSFEALERSSAGCSDWQETKNEFVRFIHYGDADAYMDNISIKYVYEDPNLIFSEDYDGDEITAPSTGVGTVMTEESGNKYMKMDMTIDGVTDWGATMFAYDFPEVKSGIVNIEFDYMKEEKEPQTYMVLSGTNNWNTKEMLRLMGLFYKSAAFTGFDGTAMLNNAGKTAVLEAGKWYTQKVTLNLDTKEATATVYERGGSEAVGYMHRTKLSDSTGYNGWPATSDGFVRIAHFGDTDACIDNIKITKGEAPKDYAYSMAIVGDTQTLTAKYPDTLAGLYDWIAENAESKNMKWVFGLGDITDGDTDEEWALGKANISKLDGVVPYSVIRGNHDSAEKFKAAFPYSEYADKIDGSMNGDMLNTYQKFTVGDTKYMVVNLDWGAPDAAVAWANEVIEANPNYNVILTTHAYLNSDGTTLDSGDEGAPTNYSSLNNNGDELWNDLVKKHENIVLVLSGHISSETVVATKATGVNGNTVTQMLIDPQTTDQNNVGSGLGLVAMLYFSEDGKNVDVEYYSTLKGGKYLSANQFSMELDTVTLEERALIFSENYENETVTPIAAGAGTVETDASGNKYMKMDMTIDGETDWGKTLFAYDIPEIKDGKISIEYDYMKENKTPQTYFALSGAKTWNTKEMMRLMGVSYNYGVFTTFDGSTTYIKENGQNAALTAGKWYTQKIIIDMETHNVSSAVYEKGSDTPMGGTVYKENLPRMTSNSGGYAGWPMSSDSFVRLVHFGDTDACIDNITIKYVYDDPALDSDSIKIKKADGEEELVWTDVISSAKVIDVDFGTGMYEESMTDEYIYVTKKGSADKVASTVSYKGGVATITAADNWEPGTYTIHVSGDVQNLGGVKLGDDFEVDFTVKKGNVAVTVDGIYKGETKVSGYADVTAGDVVTIKTTIKNDTGKAKEAKLVVAYYNETGALVGVSDGKAEFSADEESAKDITYTVQSFDDADNMKFFIINGYSDLFPLAVSYPLN